MQLWGCPRSFSRWMLPRATTGCLYNVHCTWRKNAISIFFDIRIMRNPHSVTAPRSSRIGLGPDHCCEILNFKWIAIVCEIKTEKQFYYHVTFSHWTKCKLMVSTVRLQLFDSSIQSLSHDALLMENDRIVFPGKIKIFLFLVEAVEAVRNYMKNTCPFHGTNAQKTGRVS